jgi:hypothetical protein
VEKQQAVHNLKTEVETTILYFQNSVRNMTPDQTIEFLEKFISAVMKTKLIAVNPSLGKNLNKNDFRYLYGLIRITSGADRTFQNLAKRLDS